MKLVSFSWEGSKPGHWAHWSQSHKESSLQEIQVAFLRYYTHLLLLRAGFPLPSFQQHGYPKALFSRSKRLKCYYKRCINKGTLISSFVFVFFRYYFIPPQNSLLLNCNGVSSRGLFFKANLLYHFYVVWKVSSEHTIVFPRWQCFYELDDFSCQLKNRHPFSF